MVRKPTQSRAKATVDAIIEAATELIAKDGAKALTTRKIADRAGISVGSLYEYFENKDVIHKQAIDRLIDDAVRIVREAMPELVQLDIRDAVFTLLMKLRELLMEKDGRYLNFIRNSFSIEMRPDFRKLQRVLIELGTQILVRRPEIALIPNIPTMLYIFIFGGTYTVIQHLSEENPPITFEELANGLADMVVYQVEGTVAAARKDG